MTYKHELKRTRPPWYTTDFEAPISLYDKKFGSMHEAGGFDQKDSLDFIKINSIRLMAHKAILNKIKKKGKK